MAGKPMKRLRRRKPLNQPSTRTLKTGETVQESLRTHELLITTRCPRKWMFVDLETGTVWAKNNDAAVWRNIGYVDAASSASIVILPSAAASIPRFDY